MLNNTAPLLASVGHLQQLSHQNLCLCVLKALSWPDDYCQEEDNFIYVNTVLKNQEYILTLISHVAHKIRNGGLAQLAERLLCMQKVRGSIPLTSIQFLLFQNSFCC